jgi:hypothetical protein
MASDDDDLWKALGFVGALVLGGKALQLMLTDPCSCGRRRPKNQAEPCPFCGRTYSSVGRGGYL